MKSSPLFASFPAMGRGRGGSQEVKGEGELYDRKHKPEGHGDGQWGEIPPGLKLCCILPGHEEWIHHLAWSPDGHLLASASKDTTIRLWNVETEGLARILKGHDDFALNVTWSPDGQMLASGSDDHTIRLWCVNSEKEVLRLTEHTDSVVSVAWSRDGSRLASGSNDNDIALWDVRTLRDVATASLHGKTQRAYRYCPQRGMVPERNKACLWILRPHGPTLEHRH